jgi:hypothetical protein
MTYSLFCAGAVIVGAPEGVPEKIRHILRASSDMPFKLVRVYADIPLKEIAATPVIACSTSVPKLLLVVEPQVPDWSPVPSKDSFKEGL